MKTLVLPVLGLVMWASNSVSAQPTATIAAQSEYVGAKTCKKCHGDQYKSWKKTKMASVFDVLRPGERTEAKQKAGLDPAQDYTRDETCLPCHTTGFGEPGGYAIPPEDDSTEAKKAQKRAREREGVQCEMCHGPASLVVAHKQKHEDYQWDDLDQAELTSGVLFPVEETCRHCHNPDSPFVGDDYVFDFTTRREQGTHRHFKMDMEHGCPHTHSISKRKKKKS